jgi:tetratricopeptide (TPR) repeat protein
MERTNRFLSKRLDDLVGHAVLEHRDVESALRRLDELRREDGISAYGLRLYAALTLQAGDAETGADMLIAAIEARAHDDKNSDDWVDRFLLAYAQLRRGDSDGALAAFDALNNDDERRIAAASQGRGDALSALGRLEAAEQAYQRCLEVLTNDYEQGFVRLDLARAQAERDVRDAALETLRPLLEENGHPTSSQARYLNARLLAAAGDESGAVEALEKLLATPGDGTCVLRARARDDRAFEALSDRVRFEVAVAEPTVDTSWISRQPALAALLDDERLSALGVRFVAEDAARSGGDELRAHYAESYHLGTLWTDALWDACQKVAEGLWLLAEGPSVPGARHATEIRQTIKLYVDPGEPETIWIGPSIGFPAALFTEVPSSEPAVADALEALYLRRPARASELSRVKRAFMGYPRHLGVPNPYSGELEAAYPHALDRHFNFSPSLDPQLWGGAFEDDPWPDVMPWISPPDMINYSRKRRQQRRGSVARLTRRAQFSLAQVGMEIHQASRTPIYVWSIRYQPNPYPQTIERFNEACGTPYPTDLPADVVAGIHGFDWLEAREIEERLETVELEQVLPYLALLAAIRYQDPELQRELVARAAGHGSADVRGFIADLCLQYGWRAALEELALAEPEAEIRGQIVDVLRRPMPETRFNDMGEPEALEQAELGDYDDDYEEEEDDDE